MSTNIVVPELGESVVEARVARWLKKPGDAVAAGDPLYFFKRHLLNMVIGIALGLVVSRIEYPQLRAYTPVLYVLSLLGLVAVLLVAGVVWALQQRSPSASA